MGRCFISKQKDTFFFDLIKSKKKLALRHIDYVDAEGAGLALILFLSYLSEINNKKTKSQATRPYIIGSNYPCILKVFFFS